MDPTSYQFQNNPSGLSNVVQALMQPTAQPAVTTPSLPSSPQVPIQSPQLSGILSPTNASWQGMTYAPPPVDPTMAALFTQPPSI